MKRRRFLGTVAASLPAGFCPTEFATSSSAAQTPLKKHPLRLGLVTYNLGRTWDIETLIENCMKTGFQGVELRSTHAHGVEIGISQEGRHEVLKRFQDSNYTSG